MSHVLTLAVGVTLGAAGMYAAHLRWAEAHHYRRVRLEATRVRDLAVMADHDHRTARRYRRALEALGRIHRDVVGDLLDTVVAQARELDRLHTPRHVRVQPAPYSPDRWGYGAAAVTS